MLALPCLRAKLKWVTAVLYIYTTTTTLTPFESTLLGTIAGYVIAWQALTFTLGLIRAKGPPGVALLAHVSVIRGTTAAGLGRAVRTLAQVRCKRKM